MVNLCREAKQIDRAKEVGEMQQIDTSLTYKGTTKRLKAIY